MKKMKNNKPKLTLAQPATYQIKVPGPLETLWVDWAEEMTITITTDDEGLSITTLTGNLDQAALQGLLRRLYALGLPLISVICVEVE